MISLLRYFFKLLFGKNYTAVWTQFALECDGVYSCKQEEKVEIKYRNYNIIIDNYTHYIVSGGSSYESEYLRAVVDIGWANELELLITPQDIFEQAAKLLGAQDIPCGDLLLDKKFMIRGNDPFKIQNLLANDKIREYIQALQIIRVAITSDTGIFDEKTLDGNSMVYYVSRLKVKNATTLHALFQLMTEIIDSLIISGISRPQMNTV